MTGKEKCELLRQIRREIAETNGITYTPTECTYTGGDCLGTCPKCDEEIAYLDAALNKKVTDGGTITLSRISLDTFRTSFSVEYDESSLFEEPIMGEMEAITDDTFDGWVYALPIEDLDLSLRTFNCLKRAGILTIADMIKMSADDYMGLRNMSKAGVDEIVCKLKYRGLHLRDDEDHHASGSLF